MHTVQNLDELSLPLKHRQFIAQYLANIRKFDCIEQIILFGSCAKGQAHEDSDVDLFVITRDEIPEELEFEIVFGNVPVLEEGYLQNDILLKSRYVYDKYKNETGMVQKAVEREGVDLTGFLSVSQ